MFCASYVYLFIYVGRVLPVHNQLLDGYTRPQLHSTSPKDGWTGPWMRQWLAAVPSHRFAVFSDYGYMRDSVTDQCIEDAAFVNKQLDICLRGHLEKIVTEGYAITTFIHMIQSNFFFPACHMGK